MATADNCPVRDRVFDAAYCIGAPSIVGLHRCLAELARAVKIGGTVVVSDIVWRSTPGLLGAEWRWLASMQQTTNDDYVAAINAAGLDVIDATIFPASVWDVYHQPMREVAAALREADDAETRAHADQIDGDIEMEQRAVAAFIDYAMYVLRPASSR